MESPRLEVGDIDWSMNLAGVVCRKGFANLTFALTISAREQYLKIEIDPSMVYVTSRGNRTRETNLNTR
jgi:hypothetical protein